MKREVGKTKDVGFEFGIRRTFDIAPEKAWQLLFSLEGLGIWLGKLNTYPELKQKYITAEGREVYIRIWKMHSHIRLDWKQPAWENLSRIQVRVIPNKGKSTISFHHEKLRDAEQRVEVSKYWNEVMERIARLMMASS